MSATNDTVHLPTGVGRNDPEFALVPRSLLRRSASPELRAILDEQCQLELLADAQERFNLEYNRVYQPRPGWDEEDARWCHEEATGSALFAAILGGQA